MKIVRSTKCSLKYLTESKKTLLDSIFSEYSKVVNSYINLFWNNQPNKYELLKPIIDQVQTWFSFRLKKVASREALDMINSQRKKEIKVKPVHSGKRMCLNSMNIDFQKSKSSKEFDCWIHLHSIGNKIIFNIPIKLHKHFHKLASKGTRLNSYVLSKDSVQFCFEIETGPKLDKINCIGIDTGINALATLNTGEQFGTDIKQCIARIRRKQHGSKAQKKARRSLRQRMDETAKEVVKHGNLIVVENLKNITKGTKFKKRLNQTMRFSIGSWNVRYWLSRLKSQTELNRVSFRSVNPWKTSQTCSACGYADRKNRSNEKFLCLSCSHIDNADINAAKNILERFLSGPYGSGCKPLLINLGGNKC